MFMIVCTLSEKGLFGNGRNFDAREEMARLVRTDHKKQREDEPAVANAMAGAMRETRMQ